MTSRPPHPRRSGEAWAARLFIFAAGATSRLAFLALRGPSTGGDTPDYLRLAHNLLESGDFSLSDGPPFVPSIRRPPLYPLFLALTHGIHDWSPTTIAGVQCIIGALTGICIYELAILVVPKRRAFWLAILGSIHPGLVPASASINTEALFIPLLAAGVVLVAWTATEDELWWPAAGGGILGLAALCRPIAVPLPFLFALALLVWPERGRRGRSASALVLTFLVVIVPWVARSSFAAGRLVLVQGASPANFYLATLTQWNQLDYPTFWSRFEREDPYGERLRQARSPRELVRADDWAERQAVINILADPGRYVAARMRYYPFLVFNSFNSFTGIRRGYGELFRTGGLGELAVKSTMLVVFSISVGVLSIPGLWRAHENFGLSVCSIVWIYTMVVHLPMWIEFRFWEPAIPMQLVSAAHGYGVLSGWASRRRTEPERRTAIAVAYADEVDEIN